MRRCRTVFGDLCYTPRRIFFQRHSQRIISNLACSVDDDLHSLYEYTSGRWLWNEKLRYAERKRPFNVTGLKILAAKALHRREDDVVGLTKLAEGGFNRTFLLRMRDGFQMVARIPYPVTEPKELLIGSEVATLDYLRARNIRVPEVYGYSTTSQNPAGTEYIFMEFVGGNNLGDIWHELGEKARIQVVQNLVELESRLFAMEFPASGSLYYDRDLDEKFDRVPVSEKFCIGPDTTLGLWFGRRRTLSAFRGPYKNSLEVLVAGARKEIEYLSKYGRPLQPFQRLRREAFGYQPQSPVQHIEHLKKYLAIAPYLVPRAHGSTRPTLRHPDIQPNNVFVSDDLAITGLIDWQYSVVRPLFLQGGIPTSLQNHGDDVSDSLETPKLREDFDHLSEEEQLNGVLLLRKRQLHYYYVKETAELCPDHRKVLTDDACILRRRLFGHASEPWEGDNLTLKADLIGFMHRWPSITRSIPGADDLQCPVEFSQDEVDECLRLAAAMDTADSQFKTCMDLVDAGPEGWVATEHYEEAKRRAQKLLDGTLEEAEDEQDVLEIRNNWIFDDFDEEEYL